MPTYVVGSGNSLPHRTLDYLANGASVGSRHRELFAAACQFRDNGYGLDEAASQCVPRAVLDGLDENHSASVVASAFRREPRGKARKVSVVGADHPTTAAPPPLLTPPIHEPLPAPEKLPAPIPDGLRVLVETLFRPGEGIGIGKGYLGANGNLDITRGTVRTWERWQAFFQKRSLEQMNDAGQGVFFRINPTGGSSDADVTDLRHALAEIDCDDNGCVVPKEIQYAVLLRSKLPIAALIDSGGKSLHAIVRVDAPTRVEYDRRVKLVLGRVPWLDTQNKNPSRYSRLPDVFRKCGQQLLLATNIGALDWLSWEEEIKEETPEEILEEILRPPWPVLDPAAYHGSLGRIARDIEPHTEADPAGVLLQLLMMFGCTIGRRPFYPIEGVTHHTNLFGILVGKTSRSRKGTAWGRARQVFSAIQESAPIKAGLSTGEGLVEVVHDDIKKWVPASKGKPGHFVMEKPAVADKRLYVAESEFGRVLTVMDREGNSLSEFLRESWETGDLGSMTRNNPITATGVHITICGQITRDELFLRLNDVDIYNGLCNRFLWWCVRRSQLLPKGGEPDIHKVTEELERLKEAVLWARTTGELHRTDDAEEFWSDLYHDLNQEIGGAYGAVTCRGEAQVLRLSMIYALADKSVKVTTEHLKAAIAVWNYARDSVRHLFAKELSDPNLLKLFRALRKVAPDWISRGDVSVNVFHRNASADQLERWFRVLEEGGHAIRKHQKTAGRPVEMWKTTY
jgi:hypothetical protein